MPGSTTQQSAKRIEIAVEGGEIVLVKAANMRVPLSTPMGAEGADGGGFSKG